MKWKAVLGDRMSETQTITLTTDEIKNIRIDTSGVYDIWLAGAGAEATISGAFEAHGAEKIAVTINIHHTAPHTRSSTILKGVARDTAQVSFTGRIIVAEKCPDTNAFLTERILLLSDTAKAEAVPDLEILTDDVKCSHAASISHIPESQLFYLMSRGLSKKSAEELIVEGFLQLSE